MFKLANTKSNKPFEPIETQLLFIKSFVNSHPTLQPTFITVSLAHQPSAVAWFVVLPTGKCFCYIIAGSKLGLLASV